MKVQFVAHASFIVEANGLHLLCDPWLEGKVFNNGWALVTPPAPVAWDSVDYIWISHEHPDHWSFPTLRQIPDADKRRIRVLYQRHASARVADAIRALGFAHLIELPLYRWCTLAGRVRVYCGSVGATDSFLAIADGEDCVLNLNDCVLNADQVRYIKRAVGTVSLLFSQFSFASWVGNDHDELGEAERTVQHLRQRIEIIEPEVTVPFASFVYFCNEENCRMNAWANTPDMINALQLETVQFMYPGDNWDSTARTFRSAEALARYRHDYALMTIDRAPAPVPIEKIDQAIVGWLIALRGSAARRLMLRRIPPFDIFVKDLAQIIEVQPVAGTYRIDEATPARADAARYVMCSQVAWFLFAFPWGVDTVWISGMFLDRRFGEQGAHPVFRLQRLAPREVFQFGGVEQSRRTVQFWWSKKQELLFRFLGKVRAS